MYLTKNSYNQSWRNDGPLYSTSYRQSHTHTAVDLRTQQRIATDSHTHSSGPLHSTKKSYRQSHTHTHTAMNFHTQQRVVKSQSHTQQWTFTLNTHTFTLNKEKLYSQSHSDEPSHSTLTPSHSTKRSYTASHTVMNLHTQHSHLHIQQRVVIQPVTQ